MSQARTDKVKLSFNAGQCIATIVCLLLLCSCGAVNNTRKPVEAQKGGTASGGGGTLQQPNNSGAPSMQDAETEVWFYPVVAPDGEPVPTPVTPVPEEGKPSTTPPPVPSVPATGIGSYEWVTIPVTIGDGRVAYMRQRVQTSLGQHQSLSDIIKQAALETARKMPMLIWFGILAIGVGTWMAALSHKNPDGYMMVWILTIIIGITWLMVPPHGAWLVLGIIPFGLWAGQKTGVLKFPGVL